MSRRGSSVATYLPALIRTMVTLRIKLFVQSVAIQPRRGKPLLAIPDMPFLASHISEIAANHLVKLRWESSASGANGDGFGALLAFEADGRLRGPFSHDDRIADPRGLAVNSKENLLFLNSGTDRVLAISSEGHVVRDTGRIEGLNPGGGTFGPDDQYYVGLRGTRTIIALSTSLDDAVEQVLPPRVVPYPRGFAFGQDGKLYLASGIGPDGKGRYHDHGLLLEGRRRRCRPFLIPLPAFARRRRGRGQVPPCTPLITSSKP